MFGINLSLPTVATLGSGGFSLSAFMASQADGFWYDVTKTDRFFQFLEPEALADDVGESIGLALDQRSWGSNDYAAQAASLPELVVNGSFSVDASSWTQLNSAVVTVSVTGAKITNGIAAEAIIRQTISGLTVGDLIRLRATKNSGNVNGFFVPSSGLTLLPGGSNRQFGVGASYVDTFMSATATSIVIGFHVGTATIGDYIEVDDITARRFPGRHGRQTTGAQRPIRQVSGAKFDGSDDNWLTSYAAQNGANFLGCRTTVPATLSSTQIILGASGSGANRVFLGIDTSGRACGGVGSDSTTTIVGTSDLRNTEANVFLTFDGSTVRLIVNGVVEYEAAQNSTPTTSIPFRVGALNNNGTAGSFYAGAVRKAWVGREFITASRARQIAA